MHRVRISATSPDPYSSLKGPSYNKEELIPEKTLSLHTNTHMHTHTPSIQLLWVSKISPGQHRYKNSTEIYL